MYQGTAMDGFPNFFAIFGPNTATGHSSVILASENMVEYTIKLIKPILRGYVESVEVKKSAETAYTADIQRQLKKTVWHTGGCHSWYKTEDDWNSTVFPYSQVWFTYLCMFPKWSDWNLKYTSKGIRKTRTNALLKFMTCAILITGIIKARKANVTSFVDISQMIKGYLSDALLMTASTLQTICSKI